MRARDAAAEAVDQIELLEIEDAELADALATIEQSLDSQTARVDGARQALEAAELELAARLVALTEAEFALEQMRTEISSRAVEAYVGVGTEETSWLDSTDLNTTSIRLTLLDAAAGRDRDLVDELRSLEAERAAHADSSALLRDEAAHFRLALEAELRELEARQATFEQVRDELQARIAEWEQTAAQRAEAADEFKQLIRQTQIEALGFDLGDPGAASVEGFILPLDGQVGSPFGSRRHPIYGIVRMHNGLTSMATPETRSGLPRMVL